MRVLTPGEKIVVGALLSGESGSRPSWNRGSDLPRRTEQTVRQRVFARRWVEGRYLVDPAAIGHSIVSIVIARPFADRVRELGSQWSSTPESILVWESPDLVLGIFLSESPKAAGELGRQLRESGTERESSILETDCRESTIPVWFDFERMWTKFAGLPGPARYPRGLPRDASTPRSSDDGHLPPRERRALTGLLSESAEPYPRRFTSAERVLLRRGAVEHRHILDPMTLSGWLTGFPDGIVIVQGERRPECRPARLFGTLVRDAGVAPFLFAFSEERLLLATLSGPLGVERGAPDRQTARPVLPIIGEHLSRIRVDRAALSTIRRLKSHDYTELLAGPDPEAEPRGPRATDRL